MWVAVPRPRPLAVALGVRKAIVNEVTDKVIDYPVEGLTALIARRDQLHSAQEPELVTQGRHGEPKCPGQISDAQLVVGERVHDSDSCRVGGKRGASAAALR